MFHHIEMFEKQWQILGFSWTEKGDTRFYVFPVLPFGLTSAGYIFTKVCRELVRYWRSFGIKIVVYLDDGVGAVDGKERCKQISNFVRASIEESGFIANEKKSIWEPTQIMSWLGLVICPLTHRRTHVKYIHLAQNPDDFLAYFAQNRGI